jgi:beta-1,4-N-acetylglucosaminyltransferase
VILVIVGMHTQPFDRLVRAADELASLLDERIIIQRGVATHLPQFAQHVDFVDETQIDAWLFESRVVLSHAGAGSILGALRARKPLVLAPRTVRFGEHGDDHQFELAEVMAKRGWAVMVTDLSVETLSDAIAQAEQLRTDEDIGETGLYTALRDWLVEQSARRSRRRRPFQRRRWEND